MQQKCKFHAYGLESDWKLPILKEFTSIRLFHSVSLCYKLSDTLKLPAFPYIISKYLSAEVDMVIKNCTLQSHLCQRDNFEVLLLLKSGLACQLLYVHLLPKCNAWFECTVMSYLCILLLMDISIPLKSIPISCIPLLFLLRLQLVSRFIYKTFLWNYKFISFSCCCAVTI